LAPTAAVNASRSTSVEKGLGAAGFAVTVTADGPAALAQAQTGQFDLMILDIGLPGCDGFDILQTPAR
jgi:DNA-binding response OmpR family regulator